MRPFSISRALVLGLFLVASVFLASPLKISAETNRIAIPKGVTPQIEGNQVTMRNNNGNVSGTFSCTCSKSGACSVSNTGTAIVCIDLGGANHCTGTCSMGTVISARAAGAATKNKSQK